MRLLLLFLVMTASAWAEGYTVKFEPIVGYDRDYRTDPEPRTRIALTYGGRAIAGYKQLSGEFEYTRTDDTEQFSNLGNSTRTETNKVKLGIRSDVIPLGTFGDIYVRGGGQGSKTRTTKTQSGVTSVQYSDIQIHPYLGTGVQVHMTDALNANLGVTAVFKDFNDLNRTEIQTQLAFSISLGTSSSYSF